MSRVIGFDNRALAGQKLIGQLHQAVFQIVSRFREKLNSKRPEQLFGKLLRGMASIDEDLSIRMLMKVCENRGVANHPLPYFVLNGGKTVLLWR